MGWLPEYKNRKPVTITGQTGAGTNYQVKLSIGEDSGGDFSVPSSLSFPNDLRFTDNDGMTELDYWIEDLTVDPVSVWVEVADDLGSNVDIYCYYGKSGDSTTSSIADTFIWSETFEDDMTGWTSVSGKDNCQRSSDIAHQGTCSLQNHNDSSAEASKYDLGSTYNSHRLIGFFYDSYPDNITFSGTFLAGDQAPETLETFLQAAAGIAVYRYRIGATTYESSLDRSTGWHRFEFTQTSSARTGYIDGTQIFSTALYTQFRYIAFGNWWNASSDPCYLDSIALGKYASTEPAFSSAGAEETVPSYSLNIWKMAV